MYKKRKKHLEEAKEEIIKTFIEIREILQKSLKQK